MCKVETYLESHASFKSAKIIEHWGSKRTINQIFPTITLSVTRIWQPKASGRLGWGLWERKPKDANQKHFSAPVALASLHQEKGVLSEDPQEL